MEDQIILVDEKGNEIGYGGKMEVHKKSLLHLAFSVFIFDWSEEKMLLQKRAQGKYHSGGLWTNACCSHPRKGKTMEECLSERMKEELGIKVDVQILDPDFSGNLDYGKEIIYRCGMFKYFADFDTLSEHEIDNVFLYSPIGVSLRELNLCPNPDEVQEICWISLRELDVWIQRAPEDFTAWFQQAYSLARKVLERQKSAVNCNNGIE